ncbi:NUDIX hydrolase domain-like protein [Crepidotus variabilis]|uniref:NUDIX hydrolase domain-like protein n=1 Tax=Crepidotus variabilis TaxID=179855 RepID=A0A9P6EDH8_9AGAR|nr:NUDIX hydrolase domain-like protein [Crepidotus variabilis]
MSSAGATGILSHFSRDNAVRIQRLLDALSSTKEKQDTIALNLKDASPSKLAAVFVLLFEEDKHLRVLLTTRGKTLKFHGGETALPGGMRDETDGDLIHTARREALEEVSLPFWSPHVHTLGTLDPHMFYNLTVIPVIALLTDNTLLLDLRPRPQEVEHIFTHSLEAFLDPNLAQTHQSNLVDQGSGYWPFESKYHYFRDYDVKRLGGTLYRYHQFRSSASPVTGLTADILLETAGICFGREPQFERWAPTQLRTYEEVAKGHDQFQITG